MRRGEVRERLERALLKETFRIDTRFQFGEEVGFVLDRHNNMKAAAVECNLIIVGEGHPIRFDILSRYTRIYHVNENIDRVPVVIQETVLIKLIVHEGYCWRSFFLDPLVGTVGLDRLCVAIRFNALLVLNVLAHPQSNVAFVVLKQTVRILVAVLVL